MKLPSAPATATALAILAATIALPAPAGAQTYDPSYPACRSTKAASRTSISSATIARWRSVRRRLRAARPNAWSIHITAGRSPSAASVNNSIEANSIRRRSAYSVARLEAPPFTSRRCRARAALVLPWRFVSCRPSGSAGRLRSRRRSRPCRGPTVRRRTRCIAPRNSARQDTKFDARPPAVHLQSRRLMFPDTAPARTSNANSCDSPLRTKRGWLSPAHQA
jgi:hypothetical protein